MTHCRKPSHSRTKENRYSDPGGTLENKLNDPKPLFSRKKSLTFQKRSKKMSLPSWRANLADQNKQQPLKSRTISSSQYETNLWSKHVNIVRLTEAIRRCVCWRTQVFKIEGFVCKRFLPLPLPLFSFFGSCFISRAAKARIPFLRLSLLRNQTETLAIYRDVILNSNYAPDNREQFTEKYQNNLNLL